ncbi:MAG: 30S ribosomal protein S9 [Bacteroidaceae bacterium]|nr:30S ribosomal protein S9 [Bacteroidaceae bacterium]
MEVINALGRRKSAVARVYLTEGTGKIIINKRELKDYFPSELVQFVVKQPLNLLGVAEKYDIKVNVYGGGYTGQSQALRLAIARALVKINAEDKKALRAEGFITRDARTVERKKPGQPKARRRFQFSKR